MLFASGVAFYFSRSTAMIYEVQYYLYNFTGAWIITGGTATGVMQFVGEAVRDHLITLGSNDNNIVALGIATWGCIANREALDGEEVS